MKIKAFFCVMALILYMGALCFPAYASDGGENMVVNAAWLDGEMLRINVTDEQTGVNSSLAIRLSDYIKETDNSEYISIQAVDLEGNKSGVIQLKNPYYKPLTETEAETDSKKQDEADEVSKSETTQSAIPNGEKAFTPDGTGTVIDNVTDSDGKEFFTITTEDDNVFYLIVDQQRNSDNVYLLNAVTENDLMALSQKSGNAVDNGSTSVIPSPEQNTPQQPEQLQPTPEPESEPVTPVSNNNMSTIIFVMLATLIVGGAGYYFKIYKPKKEAADTDDDDMDYEDEPDEAEEYESDFETENEEDEV